MKQLCITNYELCIKFSTFDPKMNGCSYHNIHKILFVSLSFFLGILPIKGQTDDEYELDSAQTTAPIVNAPLLAGTSSTLSPWMGPGLCAWNLHPGLNGQVGAGINVGFGKHNPWKGASFFSTLAGLYVFPTSKNGKWTGAAGGYLVNHRLWGQQVNSAGIMGLVDYRINDKMSATGFLMHDFGIFGKNDRMGYCPIPGLDNPATTIGAAMNMKLCEKAILSVGVSLTHEQLPAMPYNFHTPEPAMSGRGARDIMPK